MSRIFELLNIYLNDIYLKCVKIKNTSNNEITLKVNLNIV